MGIEVWRQGDLDVDKYSNTKFGVTSSAPRCDCDPCIPSVGLKKGFRPFVFRHQILGSYRICRTVTRGQLRGLEFRPVPNISV